MVTKREETMQEVSSRMLKRQIEIASEASRMFFAGQERMRRSWYNPRPDFVINTLAITGKQGAADESK